MDVSALRQRSYTCFCPFCGSSNYPVFVKNFFITCLITCRAYGLQYMGETSQPLRARINGHQSDITPRRTDVSLITEHFYSSAHSVLDMTVIVIELSPSCDPCLQKLKDSRWIRTLETMFLSGLNVWVDSLWNLCLLWSSVHPWVFFSSLMSFPFISDITIPK